MRVTGDNHGEATAGDAPPLLPAVTDASLCVIRSLGNLAACVSYC